MHLNYPEPISCFLFYPHPESPLGAQLLWGWWLQYPLFPDSGRLSSSTAQPWDGLAGAVAGRVTFAHNTVELGGVFSWMPPSKLCATQIQFSPHRSGVPFLHGIFFFFFCFLLFRAVPTAYGSPLGVELQLQPQPQQYQIWALSETYTPQLTETLNP